MNLRERELRIEQLEKELARHKKAFGRATSRRLRRMGYVEVSRMPSKRFGFISAWMRLRKKRRG